MPGRTGVIVFEGGQGLGDWLGPGEGRVAGARGLTAAELDDPRLLLTLVRRWTTLDTLAKFKARPEVDVVILATDAPSLAASAAREGALLCPTGSGASAGPATPTGSGASAGPVPLAFHFGRVLRRLVVEHGLERVVYLGGGSAPLLTPAEIDFLFERAPVGSRTFVANSPQSPDLVAIGSAEVTEALVGLETDNATAFALTDAGYERVLLPESATAIFDLDTPSDVMFLAYEAKRQAPRVPASKERTTSGRVRASQERPGQGRPSASEERPALGPPPPAEERPALGPPPPAEERPALGPPPPAEERSALGPPPPAEERSALGPPPAPEQRPTPGRPSACPASAGLGPRTLAGLASLDLDTTALDRAAAVLERRYPAVTLIGRVAGSTMAFLNSSLLVRLRVFSEERGMKALGRIDRGEVRSLLGVMADELGLDRLVREIAALSEVVFWDTRVIASHFSRWPDDTDRFRLDLGQWHRVSDPALRELGRAVANLGPGGPPFVLGGHSVVSGGLRLIVENLLHRS